MTAREVHPVADLPQWTDALHALAEQPLELCPDFPRIARRFEAWWNHELLDRPLLLASANTRPDRPISRRLGLLSDPGEWLEAKRQDMRQTHRVGEALPTIRADFGPVMLGSLLGGRTDFLADTTWTHAFINDQWSNAPDWTIRDDHPWWPLLTRLLQMTADDARGRYLVCTPDLGGSADVLLNLRGSSELCLDVLEQPQRIQQALGLIYPSWRRAWTHLYRHTVGRGAGVVHWLGLWSSRPYMIPACDFNYMIGPREFERLFLPDIARQAATAGRAVFHLDGPGAARHIDALLELPELDAIQFTPGEATPSALAWVGMLRSIQARGRSVLVVCPLEEVLPLCEQLRPEGLAFLSGGSDPKRIDEVYDALRQRFGARA